MLANACFVVDPPQLLLFEFLRFVLSLPPDLPVVLVFKPVETDDVVCCCLDTVAAAAAVVVVVVMIVVEFVTVDDSGLGIPTLLAIVATGGAGIS
ncbi:hypothetical protein DERF_004045 [Dermatophagoides farinae]|uniref:Uncharacterized protein n=1 Tax=Dermatophagoides farinae TaxID=6954 RepID=A0A922IG69_DERFA|nr:hypothetical protein DERF_004045 [Dermatophagoides farinae]